MLCFGFLDHPRLSALYRMIIRKGEKCKWEEIKNIKVEHSGNVKAYHWGRCPKSPTEEWPQKIDQRTVPCSPPDVIGLQFPSALSSIASGEEYWELESNPMSYTPNLESKKLELHQPLDAKRSAFWFRNCCWNRSMNGFQIKQKTPRTCIYLCLFSDKFSYTFFYLFFLM